ncbi:MAG: GTPase HflX, partial [Stomatobaculum sp.]|nr:GTPase HflX [Stomatobaculum sp.]
MAAFFGADEIWSRHDDDTKEPVVLAGVRETSGADAGLSEEDFLHSLDELAELAKACMMDPRAVVTQQMSKVSAGLYVGSGKAEEIRIAAANVGASRVIFNDTLSPSQIRNLQKTLELPVMDRTALILEIFERRARSREARLQVELAKLNYLKPRLIGMWETQNRQGGASGSMSAKGEGETQLEIDRRTIDHRLAELRREIKSVAKERELRRKKRRESGLPLVSLVGYTNAGKSTMMNALLEYCEGSADDTAPKADPSYGAAETLSSNQSPAEKKKVFEADMLFATLDTTVRKITVSRGREFLLSDTVGFIHRLPTALVEAFHSTLEEVTQADLLLQIVDGSDPHCQEHIEVTKKTVEE